VRPTRRGGLDLLLTQRVGDRLTGLAGLAISMPVAALVLEELQVDNARAHGWSWRDIARRLGVTKQAVHYKHGLRVRGGQPEQPS